MTPETPNLVIIFTQIEVVSAVLFLYCLLMVLWAVDSAGMVHFINQENEFGQYS